MDIGIRSIYAVVEDIDLSKYNYVICFSPEERDGTSIDPKRGNAVYDLKKDYFIFSNTLNHNGGASWINTSFSDFNCYPSSAEFKVIDGKFSMLSSAINREYTLFLV